MTDLVCFETPVLFAIMAIVAAVSLVCAILRNKTIISYAACLVHAFAIAATVYFGGGLTDILLMLTVSLTVSVIGESIHRSISERRNKQ